MPIARGEVWLVQLNPQRGAEIEKIRPCVVVSGDAIGKLPLKVVVPITQWDPTYDESPWFVKLEPDAQNSLTKVSAADAFQVKSLDTSRFLRKIGVLTPDQMEDIVAAVGLVIEIV